MEKKIFDIQERIQTEKKRRRTLGDVNYFFCREKENRDLKGEKRKGKMENVKVNTNTQTEL